VPAAKHERRGLSAAAEIDADDAVEIGLTDETVQRAKKRTRGRSPASLRVRPPGSVSPCKRSPINGLSTNVGGAKVGRSVVLIAVGAPTPRTRNCSRARARAARNRRPHLVDDGRRRPMVAMYAACSKMLSPAPCFRHGAEALVQTTSAGANSGAGDDSQSAGARHARHHMYAMPNVCA